jgi:formylglycine-generating enzyme required for sulfatase activity/nucleoside phosphorylase
MDGFTLFSIVIGVIASAAAIVQIFEFFQKQKPKPGNMAEGKLAQLKNDQSHLLPNSPSVNPVPAAPSFTATGDTMAITFKPMGEIHHPNRILLVAVTEVEVWSILRQFSSETTPCEYCQGDRSYFYLGISDLGDIFLAQSEMGTATPGGAITTICRAIDHLKPDLVIMCGIAFGLRPDKQEIGQILVSHQIEYYDSQKIPPKGKPYQRGDKVTASEHLLNRFRARKHTWNGAKVHFGLMLSGDKLINNVDFRDWLLSIEPEAIGGDMEGAGLYTACRDRNVPWILIKAICDWADGAKTDGAQSQAAENAAGFVYHVLNPVQKTGESFKSHAEEDLAIDGFQIMLENESTREAALVTLREKEALGNHWLRAGLQTKLLGVMRSSENEPVTRYRAGNLLSIVGDPRFKQDAWYLPDEGLLGFVEIPGGEFTLGAKMDPNKNTPHSALSKQVFNLPTFYLGKYHVTVAQFTQFKSSTKQLRDQQNDPQKHNHPIVWVSWYDAIAYCQWLQTQLLAWPGVLSTPLSDLLRNEGWIITLPSEVEWEKAARGEQYDLLFPWGSTADEKKANYAKSKLNGTISLGCYESGKSPYLIYDMGGNVSEWTRSNWGNQFSSPGFLSKYCRDDGREDMQASAAMLRVIRGGAYRYDETHMYCSSRFGVEPNQAHNFIGFRLAITRVENRIKG